MKKQHFILGFFIIALAAISILVFHNPSRSDAKVVRIGAIVCLTGQASQLGSLLQNGMLVAQEYVNNTLAKGDLPKIELVIEDSKNTTNGTLAAYNKLRAEGVDVIVSTGDVELRALNGVANDNPIPIIATSCTGGIENRSPWIFRYCYSEQSQDKDLSEFLVTEQNVHHITMIYPNNTYGQDIFRNMNEQYEMLGGTINASYTYITDATDQKAVAARIMEDKPELLCIRGFGSGFVAIIKAIRELGFSGRIVGDVTLSLPDTLKNVGNSLEGSYYVASELDVNSQKPSIQSYAALYRESYKSEPGFWDAMGFDSVVYMWEAVSAVGKDKNDIRNTLQTKDLQNGLLGFNGFNADGDLKFRTSVYVIENGKGRLIKK